MSSVTDAHPILPCLNWEETIAFYDRLGFAPGNLYPDQYLIVHRDGIQLHFWKCNDRKSHVTSNVRRPKIAHGEFGSSMLSIPMEICCA